MMASRLTHGSVVVVGTLATWAFLLSAVLGVVGFGIAVFAAVMEKHGEPAVLPVTLPLHVLAVAVGCAVVWAALVPQLKCQRCREHLWGRWRTKPGAKQFIWRRVLLQGLRGRPVMCSRCHSEASLGARG